MTYAERGLDALPRTCPPTKLSATRRTVLQGAFGPGTDDADRVDVLFCVNQTYLQHMAVAAVSLLEASQERDIHIHLMTCDHDLDETRLVQTLRSYPHASLHIYPVSDPRISDAFVSRHLTKEAYLRILAAEILPASVHRVVYLDSDLVVLDDISILTRADLKGLALGAVADCDWQETAQDDRLAGLGIRAGNTYVNSGVLVMDLDRWRRDDLVNRIFAFIAENDQKLVFHDQDALNVVLQGEIALLDRRWNLQVVLYSRFARRVLPGDYRDSETARRDPAIVHFSTGQKPWTFRAWVRKRSLYFRFLDKTAWRRDLPVHQGRAQRLEYRLDRSLLKAGIDIYVLIPVLHRVRRMLPGKSAHQSKC